MSVKKLALRTRLLIINKLLYLSDLIEKRAGIGSNLIPPKYLWSSYGSANLYESGLAFFKYFLDYCNLKRDARVLEIGCSIGRMAIPLTAYLSKNGCYEGFDIVADSIDYCKNHITPSFPNFKFHVSDVYNSYYNPEGSQRADSFQFPYPDNSFDLVFSTSVFTHMLPDGIEQYLREIQRVLKLNAYTFNTYFLLNEETLAAMNNKKTKIHFPFNMGNYYSGNKNVSECIVAFNNQDIINIHNSIGLKVEGDIHCGHWRHSASTCPTYYSSEKGYMGFQDLIVARKV